jgi:hypothetical protein
MHHCFHEKEVDDNLIDVAGHKNRTKYASYNGQDT